MNEVDLLELAHKAVARGAHLLAHVAPGAVRDKGDRDIVTDLDERIEHDVRSFLRSAWPAASFLGEELGGELPDGPTWVLDPIDGTSNFAHGLPMCAVSLALLQNRVPIVGVVDAPLLGQRFDAIAGRGARCNGKSIRASSTRELRHAVVSMGDYATGTDAASKNARRFAVGRSLAENVERVRMIGSAAIDLCWVAAGHLDACVILGNKPWDTAAGVLIAGQAGAVVTDAAGDSHTIDSAETIGAAAGIASRLQVLLRDS